MAKWDEEADPDTLPAPETDNIFPLWSIQSCQYAAMMDYDGLYHDERWQPPGRGQDQDG